VSARPLEQNDVPVVPRNHNSAGAGLFPLFDIVNLIEALPSVSSLELLSQIVVTDASGVHHGFWGEDVLNLPVIRMHAGPDSGGGGTYRSTTSSVLSSSTSDVGDLVILHDFIVAAVQSGHGKRLSSAHGTNIPACFSSAKMASLAPRPYFSKRFSPPVTWRSRRGFPIQKTL